jgi:HlyD family secretion protein
MFDTTARPWARKWKHVLVVMGIAWSVTIALLAERPQPPTPEPAGESSTPAVARAGGAIAVQNDEPSARLLTFIATRARMIAERDGDSRLRLPAKFTRASRVAAQIAANEQRLLDARRLSADSRQRDLRAKISIVRDEIAGFEKQRYAKQREIGLIKEELASIEKLHIRQLTNIARLMSLRREETRAHWDIGSLDAAVARSHLTIKDIEAQMHDDRHNLIIEAEKEIRIIDGEIGALVKSAEDLPEPLLALTSRITREGKLR